MISLTIIPTEVSSKDIETNIVTMNAPVANFLAHYGLPTENIFSPLDERRKVMTILPPKN
jgi:hypothetical protein